MKHILQLFTIVLCIAFSGCKKDSSQPSGIAHKIVPFDSVVQFLKTKIPGDVLKLDLESINKLTYKKKSIGLQIFEKASHKKFLLLRKTPGSYEGNWVDLSGLTRINTNYSGNVLLNDLNDQSNINLLIENNNVIQISGDGAHKYNNLKTDSDNYLSPITKKGSSGDHSKVALMEITLPEVIITMGDEKPDFLSLYWLFGGGGEPYTDLYMQGGGGSCDQERQNA